MMAPGQGWDVFSKKRETELYDEMRSLPIRMRDRRELYADLEAIYDFSSKPGEERKRKRIRFFKLRLWLLTLKYKFANFGLWENALREIEIQRGTLTANVFHFIRWTFLFNLCLALIALFGVFIPHAVFLTDLEYYGSHKGGGHCNTSWNQRDPKRTNLTAYALAECCYQLHQNLSLNNTGGKWVIKFAHFLGGQSSLLSTPFFYGFYSSHTDTPQLQKYRYALPIAYNVTSVVILSISFCVLTKWIGDGVAEIVRNQDGDVCIFSELVFCGFWHRAQDENEARFRRKLWLHNLRIAIRQAKATSRATKASKSLQIIRIWSFIGCIFMLAITVVITRLVSDSCYEMAELKKNSKDPAEVVESIGWSFIPPIVVAALNTLMPNIFIKVGRWESYELETSTALVICRSLLVRLLSVGVSCYRLLIEAYKCVSIQENTCSVCLDSNLKPHPTLERKTCWESLLGQELYKIIFTEIIIKILMTFIVDPARRLVKRIGYRIRILHSVGTLRFGVIRNSLDIINIQVMAWIGFYFAPAYLFAVVVYLFITFYLKKFSALVNCSDTPESYRVSRTTTIFLVGEVVSFVIVVVFLIIVKSSMEPSKGCGPFAEYKRSWEVFGLFVYDLSGRSKPANKLGEVLNHFLSMSVYIPMQVCAVAWLIHLYYTAKANHDYSESLKDLIILENQDKQYLVNRLLRLRAQYQNISYFDPLSVYDSETKYVESTNKRLLKQWRAMARVSPISQPIQGPSKDSKSLAAFPSLEELNKLVQAQRESMSRRRNEGLNIPSTVLDIKQKKKRNVKLGRKATKKRRTDLSNPESKPYQAPPMSYLHPKPGHIVREARKPKKTIKLVPEVQADETTEIPKESSAFSIADDLQNHGKDAKSKPRGLKNRKRAAKKHTKRTNRNKVKPLATKAPVMPRPTQPPNNDTDEDDYKDGYLWDRSLDFA